jgi:hypothetical protein
MADKYSVPQYAYQQEHAAGIKLGYRDRQRLSVDVRAEAIADFRAEHPTATEAQTYVALDYEEFSRIIAEQRFALAYREEYIQRLRQVIAGLRDIVSRFQRTTEVAKVQGDG